MMGTREGAREERAYAKLNIGLDILGKRPDGYHELRMVMLRVALFDRVLLERTEEGGLQILCDTPGVPADTRNLAYRAAELLFKKYELPGGLMIRLEKKIPAAAGLAGGSADAAAVLRGMNALYGLKLTEKALEELALPLGADVPYCLFGRTCLSEGIGEKLTALSAFPHAFVVLAKPEAAVSTKAVYEAYDSLRIPEHPDIDGIVSAISRSDREKIAKAAGNVLQPVTEREVAEVRTLVTILKENGAFLSQMSGSGPTVFGLFVSKEEAIKALKAVQESGLAAFTCLTETNNEIIQNSF